MGDRTVNRAVIELLATGDADGPTDVLDLMPELTHDQAYIAQFEAKRLQAPAHGPLIGYQASLVSQAAKRIGPPDMPKPYLGSLQLRNWHDRALPIRTAGRKFLIECEVGLRLSDRLQGPGITSEDARKAIASVHPALEIVPIVANLDRRSGQHLIAFHNFGTYVVFGPPAVPLEDVSHEPIELLFDGTPAASATTGDAGGGPFSVLAEMANILGRFGKSLESGMVIMTGSAPRPAPLAAGTKQVEARFGRLGSIKVAFDCSD
jgi:2-keto-4-pentenoate hydratase